MKKKKDYIRLVPRPLLDAIVRGNAIPFVGAGFSTNCEGPDGFVMPNWKMLGKMAASEMGARSHDENPLEALSAYEERFQRAALVDLIRKACGDSCVTYGEPHKLLCGCFQNLICTTNFDSLLEQAFHGMGVNPLVVRTENCLPIAKDDETTIIKIHGDFSDPARMVATERDYDLFIAQNPLLCTYVSNLFITRTMLLIGYSFDDCDLRQLLAVIRNRLGTMARPIYCIQVGADDNLVARYKRRGIDVVNIPLLRGSSYKTVLTEFLRQLKEYKDSESQKLISSTEEESKEQLILPSESNRLCYVSCSTNRLAFLKSLLGNVVRRSGVVPWWPDNIQAMDGMSRGNASEAAIRRANIRIFDITGLDKDVLSEIRLSLALDKRSTIVIAEDGSRTISDIESVEIVRYPSGDAPENDEESIVKFESRIREVLCAKDTQDTCSDLKEASRLLAVQAYDAAIVAAWTALESHFRYGGENIHPSSIYDKIYGRCRTREEYEGLRWFRHIRNQVVHGVKHVHDKDAKRALSLAQKLLDDMP